jgi:hypothetical protein
MLRRKTYLSGPRLYQDIQTNTSLLSTFFMSSIVWYDFRYLGTIQILKVSGYIELLPQESISPNLWVFIPSWWNKRRAYFAPSKWDWQFDFEMQKLIKASDHCVNLLRQVLTCYSDTGIVYFRDGPLGVINQPTVKRMCRKYDNVKHWAEEHRAKMTCEELGTGNCHSEWRGNHYRTSQSAEDST